MPWMQPCLIMAARFLIQNEEGQAFFEFFIFLPLLTVVYLLCASVGDAINTSINQQKVTRSYFYYRMQNNSTIPKPRRVTEEPAYAWNTFGQQINIWAETAIDDVPVATCHRFRPGLSNNSDDENCEEGYTDFETQFIRVGTVYGVCGATYRQESRQIYRFPHHGAPSFSTINSDSCLIK